MCAYKSTFYMYLKMAFLIFPVCKLVELFILITVFCVQF